MTMTTHVHPVLKALHDVCGMDIAKYDAIISIMQEAFFSQMNANTQELNRTSVNHFLSDLASEEEICYSKQATIEAMLESGNNIALVQAIFGTTSSRH